tara:strand:- start:747 stop:899 length:153 start_codon:yes stop_codon:yes gene_type:complete
MKVSELINELQKLPKDLDVIVWGEQLQDNYNITSIETDSVNKVEAIIIID